MKKRKLIMMFLSMFLLVMCISQINSAETSAKEAKYKIKTETAKYKDKSGKVRGIVSFQYPQFEETNTQIKYINKTIKNKRDSYMKSDNAKSLKEYTLDSIKSNGFFSDSEQYYYKTECNVTYNTNNIVSVKMTWSWYAGGVCNGGSYGFNYNLKTGKKLTYKDVISGNAKSKILKASKKIFSDFGTDTTSAYKTIKNAKSYNFYFIPGKVYICFESYELDLGSSEFELPVGGKYK